MRALFSALIALTCVSSFAAGPTGDLRVFPAGSVTVDAGPLRAATPISPASPTSPIAVPKAERYLPQLVGMVERGVKEKCGTELVGELVFAVPALLSTGTPAERATNGEWAHKRFEEISKLHPDLKNAPREVATPACARLHADYVGLVRDPAYNALLQAGLHLLMQQRPGAAPQP